MIGKSGKCMRRLSGFFLLLTLLVVVVFFGYHFQMTRAVKTAIEDTKTLSKQSLPLNHEVVVSHQDGQRYVYSPGHSTTDLHGQMIIAADLYEQEKPLASNDFSVLVPQAVDTGLKGVRKVLVHYRRYHRGLLSVDKVDERVIRSYHIKDDETAFTLGHLLQNYGARIDEEVLKTLSDQAVSNPEAILASIFPEDVLKDFHQTLLFSDQITYLEDSILLESPLLQTPIKVPYASLFDVIAHQYLQGKALEAYKLYEAEEKARQEAEEAARIEEERLRQLSAFDYGPVLLGERVVALTFDDGPNPATTPQVLDILARYGAKATFYVLGSAIDGNTAILQRMVNSGHEIGNHTWNHPKLTGLTAEQIAWQFNTTTDAIKAATGNLPKTFRPPYGATSAFVKSQTNLTQILWTVDTLDWQNKSTEAMMGHIRASLQPGGVILMHDIHPTTMYALPTIMDYLVAEGYRFVTISELYGLQ